MIAVRNVMASEVGPVVRDVLGFMKQHGAWIYATVLIMFAVNFGLGLALPIVGLIVTTVIGSLTPFFLGRLYFDTRASGQFDVSKTFRGMAQRAPKVILLSITLQVVTLFGVLALMMVGLVLSLSILSIDLQSLLMNSDFRSVFVAQLDQWIQQNVVTIISLLSIGMTLYFVILTVIYGISCLFFFIYSIWERSVVDSFRIAVSLFFSNLWSITVFSTVASIPVLLPLIIAAILMGVTYVLTGTLSGPFLTVASLVGLGSGGLLLLAIPMIVWFFTTLQLEFLRRALGEPPVQSPAKEAY